MSQSHTNPSMIASCHVLDAGVTFVEQTLVQPFIISSGTIGRLTEARVRVVVQTPAGEAEGVGSIYLSDLWAWPDPALSHELRDGALRQRCEFIAEHLGDLVGGETAHPLELGLQLHESVCVANDDQMPALALAMCLSPFDAAIHDAAGRALGMCAMHFYDTAGSINTSADHWFKDQSAVKAIAKMLAASPRNRLAAWVLVGKQDDMERDVRPWFDRRGYRCFKLKLHGRDVAEDVARTSEMANAAATWGCAATLSVDTNEACADAAFVLEYLETLRRDHATAFAHLAYLEQPTARDIATHPFDWRAVGRLKPVLLDEGLTSLDLLPVAAEQGWSGLALKTCKGHSFALVAAAWAHEQSLTIAMQDLTNPGVSAIHAAVFAAHVPTINGLELNSPQFTPAANEPYRDAWPGLFDVRDGRHVLSNVAPLGLGGQA